ncbi:hypothetical protein [Pseudoduganella lutea]|uniref:Exo-alpha-sialidase n=1 Tax=Pseudoduganella lutea TaxID=321985 RepID=A0A4P6L6F6_9BURK|nr:hypothetical protein [Pseudoduganella lutea]QBE66538.1 hypothetical protein EWM63_29185 [Pseudoduganella lutea]
MSVFLDKKRWQQVFDGYEIVDVALLDKNSLQFVAKKSISSDDASQMYDGDIPTRLVVLYTDRAAGVNCGFIELDGMAYPSVGVSRHPFPRPSGMAVSRNRRGDVYPRGGGVSGPMEQIDPSGRSPGIERLKCINGFTYAPGIGRALYKRVDVGKWVPFDEGIPKIKEVTTKMGFLDIDAFSDTDMYAVGGHGDVWHFDGQSWKQMGFPSNVQLATVTCAGDGNVYISGEGGSLWVGGKSTWRSVYKGTSSVLWNDALWFQDKLWLSSDYQFCQLNDGKVERVIHEGETVPMSGHMDVHDGLLVIATLYSVRSFDGSTWRRLIESYDD